MKLIGNESNNEGIGARVEVVAGELKMIREIDGGASSHLSQNSTIAHFGLGKLTKIDKIVITWVGGKRQVFENPKINKLIEIQEEKSKPSQYWKYIIILFLIAFSTYFLMKSTLRKNK